MGSWLCSLGSASMYAHIQKEEPGAKRKALLSLDISQLAALSCRALCVYIGSFFMTSPKVYDLGRLLCAPLVCVITLAALGRTPSYSAVSADG